MLESFKQLFFDRTFRKHTFRQGLLWTLLAVILGLAAHCTQLGGSHAPALILGMGLLWVLGLSVMLMSGRWKLHQTTERKHAESPLGESERRLSHLIENLPGFVSRSVKGAGWNLEYLSEGIRELTSYRPEEFLGDRQLSLHRPDPVAVPGGLPVEVAASLAGSFRFRRGIPHHNPVAGDPVAMGARSGDL